MGLTGASMANMDYWNYLPMQWSNYGGDGHYQCTDMPLYNNNQLNIAFSPIAAQSWGINGLAMGGGVTPQINQQAAVYDGQVMTKKSLDSLTSQEINTALGLINQAKMSIQSKLSNKDITAEEKARLENLLKELEQKEKEVKELKDSNDKKPDEAYQQSKDINKAIRQITLEINNPEAKKADDDKKADEDKKSDDTKATDADKKDDKTKTKQQGSIDEFDTDTQSWVEAMYDSMDGPGTKNDIFNAGLDDINSDNVMQRLLCFNKYKSGIHQESFMEMFMWDANRKQKIQYGRQIALALRLKADELGIYDECKEDFAAIDKEMGSWIYVKNSVAKNYDNIIARIAKKMGSQYGEPQKSLNQAA